MNKILLFLIGLLVCNLNFAQTKVSIGNGNWSNAGIWSPAGVPTSADNVLISNGNKVRIDGNYSCKSLTVGTSALTMSTLEFRGGAHSFTVFGDTYINNGDTFDIKINSNTTHTATFYGNIVNNGGIQFYPDGNSRCIAQFVKNGNQSITGTGSFSKFYFINLNMGTSNSNILDVSVSNFTVPVNFLTLNNGTFKISTTGTQNITTFTAATNIPSTAGLWLNSANLTVNTGSDVTNAGVITVSNGTLNIGNAANEDLIYSAGSISIAAGAINVAGIYTGSGNTSLSISGGTLNLNIFGSTTDITNAPFQISTSGSIFNMSNGLICINQEGGNGSQDLGYVNLSGSGSVTGGTLQIGASTSPANQIYKINSTALVPNLLINHATATASVFTNPLNVVNNITFNAGTLNSNNLNISLGGNWLNNGGTFTAGTASVTFNSTSSQSIFKSGGETFNHLVFNGSGAKSLAAPITANGNITINSGSNLDVSASNFSITAKGNFMNSGTYNSRSGNILFNGTLAHTIGGTSVTDFFDITLSNTSNGATLTNAENLIGTLILSGGTFNTNSQVFTMVSTATATARIAQITGTGDIIGNVTVQRFAPGGTTGWALLGTPISSALTLNDWDDDIAISCPTCPDGNASNFLSIYTYDETAPGTYSDVAAYIPLSTINDPITPNKGYWVYLGDGLTTTNNITLDVTGTVRKGNQTIPLSITNNAAASEIGWNLIHNPYPSAISWAALKGATSNIDNAIYVFNADLNGGAGANATYVNGVSSPAVGSGGIGDVIPMCQAFYVHSTGATALNATEAIKVAGNPTFLRVSNQQTNPLLRLKLKRSTGYSDECVLYQQNGATPNFDASYDAIKMSGQDPYAPTISLENGSEIFQINGVAPIAGTFTTFVKALTGYNGSYTISASDLNSFPVGTCFKLIDRFTNTTTDLLTSDYVFYLIDTTTVSRFILKITIDPLQITSNVNQPTCNNINGGAIIAKGLNAGPWNYFWKDVSNNVIQTSLNRSTADTLRSLWVGNYNLDITTVGGCDNNQSAYTIIQQIPAYANFTSIDTVYLDVNPNVQFNNTSLNYQSQSWDFGDQTGISNIPSPAHNYQSVGNYLVSLTVVSASGCADTINKNIVVMNKPVGVLTNSKNTSDLKIKSISNGKYILEKEFDQEVSFNYELMDISGKALITKKEEKGKKLNLSIDLTLYNKGIYFVNIEQGGFKNSVKLINN